jgi:NAD(P)-dependent dehydrogenase (short-subunit alcohol dehydrogenase family)
MNNIFDLKNKKIVISGGAGFLGTEFSFAISAVGAIPIILDQSKKALNSLEKKFKKRKLQGEFFQVDLFNEVELNKIISIVIKKYKTIDCLINLASYYSKEPKNKKNHLFDKFEEYNFKVWEKSLSGNLSSNFNIIKSVSKYMLKKKTGSIINIASDVGIISPDHRIYEPNKKMKYKGVKFNTPLSYAVSKAGIISMTRYLATYWAKSGIRVNCISPAGVYRNHNKKFVEQLSERIPLGRMAKKHEFNGAIIYLCSSASSFVTGHNLIIDGGRTIW